MQEDRRRGFRERVYQETALLCQ